MLCLCVSFILRSYYQIICFPDHRAVDHVVLLPARWQPSCSCMKSLLWSCIISVCPNMSKTFEFVAESKISIWHHFLFLIHVFVFLHVENHQSGKWALLDKMGTFWDDTTFSEKLFLILILNCNWTMTFYLSFNKQLSVHNMRTCILCAALQEPQKAQ